MRKAAILVSHAEKGMDVHIILADSTATASDNGCGDGAITQGQSVRCFTNQPDMAGWLGFRHATLAQMALMLKDADVVLPF